MACTDEECRTPNSAQYPAESTKFCKLFYLLQAKTTKISNDEPNHEKSAVWGRPGLPHQLKTTWSDNEIEKECLKSERQIVLNFHNTRIPSYNMILGFVKSGCGHWDHTSRLHNQKGAWTKLFLENNRYTIIFL
ncbi:MAG TPA: hypothetical protein VEX17_03875 [Bacillales bacterium]|nr:hypothetical protein [Bacillales bacterium]